MLKKILQKNKKAEPDKLNKIKELMNKKTPDVVNYRCDYCKDVVCHECRTKQVLESYRLTAHEKDNEYDRQKWLLEKYDADYNSR